MSMQEAQAQGKANTPNVKRYFSPLQRTV